MGGTPSYKVIPFGERPMFLTPQVALKRGIFGDTIQYYYGYSVLILGNAPYAAGYHSFVGIPPKEHFTLEELQHQFYPDPKDATKVNTNYAGHSPLGNVGLRNTKLQIITRSKELYPDHQEGVAMWDRDTQALSFQNLQDVLAEMGLDWQTYQEFQAAREERGWKLWRGLRTERE